MQNLKNSTKLFFYFFRVGWFTFGGGWSIVAQMQKDYVEDRQVLETQELLDIVSVGRSLPGTMVGNVAYLFGYHMCGVPGGVMSVLGIALPPLIILTILTMCYTQVRDNLYVAKAMVGVRAVVAPIILSAVLKLHKNAFPRRFCYLLFIAGCVLFLYFKVSCVFIVLMGIVVGLLMNRGKEAVK